VTLNDRTAGEELSRYDALISCPPRFNITLSVPPLPQSSDDRVFEVVLHDSKVEQRVFLSSFVVRDVAEDRPDFDASRVDSSVKDAGKTAAFCCRGLQRSS